MRKYFVSIGIGLTAVCGAHAQATDAKALSNFPRSVIVRVYEVASSTGISKGQQVRLAQEYDRQDSLVAAAITAGRPAREIDSLDKEESAIVRRVLNQSQLTSWCEHKGREFSNVAAAGELAYIREEYHPDSATYRSMRERVANRYDYIYQNYLLDGMDQTRSEKDVVNLARLFDNYAFYPMLYSNKYVTDYLGKLNAIKKIPDSVGNRIRVMFNNMITADKFTDWGTVINQATQFYLPDTALFSKMFHTDFVKQAYQLSASDSYNLIKLQRLRVGAYDSVYGLINAKNYSRAVLQYTYSLYHHKQFNTLVRQVSDHYDSLVTATLLRNGALQSGSQFALALRYKDILGLRPSLTDTLLDQVMYLNARRDSILSVDPDAAIDFGPYEALHLSQLLTADQYTMLLSYKNRAQAIADANADWNEMELRGITAGLNKEDVIRQITSFDILKYNAWNRLAYDKIALWATQRVIGEAKPEALKVLDPLRWNGDTTKGSNNLKLQW